MADLKNSTIGFLAGAAVGVAGTTAVGQGTTPTPPTPPGMECRLLGPVNNPVRVCRPIVTEAKK